MQILNRFNGNVLSEAETLIEAVHVAPRNEFGEANLREAEFNAPVVENLDRKILDRITQPGALKMSQWHCGTAHCLSGWAIVEAGPEGAKLEAEFDPGVAGALIFAASTGTVPNFFGTNEEALAEMRNRAAITPPASPGT